MTHRRDDATPFEPQRQVAELERVMTSRVVATALAENDVGMAAVRAAVAKRSERA